MGKMFKEYWNKMFKLFTVCLIEHKLMLHALCWLTSITSLIRSILKRFLNIFPKQNFPILNISFKHCNLNSTVLKCIKRNLHFIKQKSMNVPIPV
jgi:hypothetical protein